MASEKLERLHEYVLVTIVMTFGVVLALYCGRLAGSGDNAKLAKMAMIAGAAIICLAMRSRIWMLIPLCWTMVGQLNSLPGHLPARDAVVGLVVVFFLTLKAFKMIKVSAVYSWLDMLMAINLLYIASLYMRRPVGVNAFGSDLVGGRPYIEIIFSVAGYWVLNQVRMTLKQTKMLPILCSLVTLSLGLLSAITYFIPPLAPLIGHIYSGVSAESYKREQSGLTSAEGDSRASFLAGVGVNTFRFWFSYASPLTMINPLYIWRFFGAILAFSLLLKSGHRLTIPSFFMMALLATYFRKGFAGVMIVSLILTPIFFLLVLMQGTLYELPYSAQRTLSFLPGKWDPDVLSEAQGSTQWRLEMWDIVMHEKKYINNKLLGDGFGFTRAQLEDMETEGKQEDFMLLGAVHSGPISAIRVAGYAGLFLFLVFQVGVAVRSWKFIRVAKGTPFFPAALFAGYAMITAPIQFVLIFGDYGNDINDAIMNVAFLNLLTNAFAEYKKDLKKPGPLTVANVTPGEPAPRPTHRPPARPAHAFWN